jgi:hypothetical protein
VFDITEQEKAVNFEDIYFGSIYERAIREGSPVEIVGYPEGIEPPEHKVIKPQGEQVQLVSRRYCARGLF